MKKIISLMLAILLILSVSSIAIAVEAPVVSVVEELYVLKSGNYATCSDIDTPKTTYAFPIEDENGEAITKSKDVKGLKAFFFEKHGKPESIKLDIAKLEGVYRYAVIFTTGEVEVGEEDIIGTIAVAKSESAAKKLTEGTVEISCTIGYPTDVNDTADYDVDNDSPVVSFNTEMSDIHFGEYATFSVGTKNQTKLNLKYSTKFNSEFASKFEYANLDFLKFEYEPSFNKTGELFIFADEEEFVYEIENGAIVKKASWDEDMGAFIFKTRKLGSYVISDVELKVEHKEITKPNPNTGR